MTAAPEPARHAAWCVGCGDFPTECFSESDDSAVTSSFDTIKTERGEFELGHVRLSLAREIGPYRSEGLPQVETHSIGIAMGPAGWLPEPWLRFTISQAATLRDKLDELLRWAASDRLD
jgi:hypothetical protein